MSEAFEREILPRVPVDRRAFLKRVVVGAAFAVPVVASFNMIGLDGGTAHGVTSNTSRQDAICLSKEKERDALEQADSKPNLPAATHAQLERRINNLTAYINAHCD